MFNIYKNVKTNKKSNKVVAILFTYLQIFNSKNFGSKSIEIYAITNKTYNKVYNHKKKYE